MISMDKKYRTRDGHEVRIYAVDGISPSPIHGAFLTIDGWATCNWTKTGAKFLAGKSFTDLIEVKPRVKKTMWLSLYPNGVVWFCTEDSKVGDDCLARVKVEIDVEEGEGL